MYGRLLKVDLTSGEMRREQIPVDWVREYIGASGLAARLLWDALDPRLDPLDPPNPLLLITGPLTGTVGTTTGRFTICGRSPQTGRWGEANIGGFVGPELRLAGFDALWISGRAAEPVYLWLQDGQAELRPAGHLWGQADTYQTQAAIRAESGQPLAKVACIGTAGENQVRMAGIFSDHGRAAARTGLGALMGSKNLKAVAARGTLPIPLGRPEAYRQRRKIANQELREQNMTAVLHETGTSGSADYLQILGDMPQKYWTQAAFDGAAQISGSEMAATILTGTSACHGCVIACGRKVTIPEGPYPTPGEVKGPEYETICSFGSQLLVSDLALITALGERCDRLGLDTISAGNTLALAYLLFERGLISEADTGGLALRWGDATPCFELLEQMAALRGFGALLAQGARALAAHFGAPGLAVEVNNLEVPMHDPRAHSGMAVTYATSPRGACHNQSDFFLVEMGGAIEELDIPMPDRFEDHGKAAHVARHQDWRTVGNSLTMCHFAVVPVQTVLELLSAASDHDWTVAEMLRAGERAWNLKRVYNIRLGLSAADDRLPELLLQPLPDGGQEGHVPDMAVLMGEYYAARGWDAVSGHPTPARLAELGLDFVKL